MRFDFRGASTVADVRGALVQYPGAALLAGGTTLIDLMKAGVEAPPLVIDINRLPLAAIDVGERTVRIGALARNSDVANDATVIREFPALSEALRAGASPQLRNMATMGGNLMQRTRCSYFRDNVSRCNKREPGSGCDARDGFNRGHAVLGTSEHCIATHASDMCVALVALDADIIVDRAGVEVTIHIADFYRRPGASPDVETVLEPGDLIVAVELRRSALARRSCYLKLRDRSLYEFALVSVAAALELIDGAVGTSRLALGGVATVPWRASEGEQILAGNPPDDATFARAADAALAGAEPRTHNAFKVELAKRAIVRALRTAAAIL